MADESQRLDDNTEIAIQPETAAVEPTWPPQPQIPPDATYGAPAMPPAPQARSSQLPPVSGLPIGSGQAHTRAGSAQLPSLGLWSILVSPLIPAALVLGVVAILRGLSDERERRELQLGVIGVVLSLAFFVGVVLIVS